MRVSMTKFESLLTILVDGGDEVVERGEGELVSEFATDDDAEGGVVKVDGKFVDDVNLEDARLDIREGRVPTDRDRSRERSFRDGIHTNDFGESSINASIMRIDERGDILRLKIGSRETKSFGTTTKTVNNTTRQKRRRRENGHTKCDSLVFFSSIAERVRQSLRSF